MHSWLLPRMALFLRNFNIFVFNYYINNWITFFQKISQQDSSPVWWVPTAAVDTLPQYPAFWYPTTVAMFSTLANYCEYHTHPLDTLHPSPYTTLSPRYHNHPWYPNPHRYYPTPGRKLIPWPPYPHGKDLGPCRQNDRYLWKDYLPFRSVIKKINANHMFFNLPRRPGCPVCSTFLTVTSARANPSMQPTLVWSRKTRDQRS